MSTTNPVSPKALMNTLVSLNPATGAPAGTVQITPPADIGHIVARARAAQPAWAAMGLEARVAMIRAAGARIQAALDSGDAIHLGSAEADPLQLASAS